MSISVSVQGGTGAGIKSPFSGSAPDWSCPLCATSLKGHWAKCPNDGTNRPMT